LIVECLSCPANQIRIGAYPELELAKLLTNDTAKLAQLSGTRKFHILSLGLKALWLDGTDFLFMRENFRLSAPHSKSEPGKPFFPALGLKLQKRVQHNFVLGLITATALHRFHKWLMSLSDHFHKWLSGVSTNHFHKRLSNARRAYSNFPHCKV